MKKIIIAVLLIIASQSFAVDTSGKVLLTGGVTQLEGAGGGGLTPWALIGSYGTEDEVGANVFKTQVNTQDYTLEVTGVMVGLFDRVELSYARQNFNIQSLGKALTPVAGTTFNSRLRQDIYGIKVKVYGDALLEQDSWVPQIAIGALKKKLMPDDTQNATGNKKISDAINADDDEGTDIYVSATKIILDQSLLLNLTLRNTKANQMGLLGFGYKGEDKAKTVVEFSAGYLLTQHIALGYEYRQKPDNLKAIPGLANFKEEAFSDLFIAWAPTKNISLTVAYATLGTIVTDVKQKGFYSSIQIGF